MQLFRPEALEGQDRLHGEVVVVAQVSWRLLGGFFAAILIAGAAFLATARYSEAVEVSGRLVADRPLVIAGASRAGTVEDLLVREGEKVGKGHPLARISGTIVAAGERGTVANLWVSRGETVAAHQPILSMERTDARLKVRFDVTPAVAASLQKSGTLRLAARGPSQRTSAVAVARVETASQTLDPNGSRAVVLDAMIEPDRAGAAPLHHGMTVSARVTTRQRTLAELLFDSIRGQRR